MAAPEKTADGLPAFESFWSCEAWHRYKNKTSETAGASEVLSILFSHLSQVLNLQKIMRLSSSDARQKR
jgi:hypothetical protein